MSKAFLYNLPEMGILSDIVNNLYSNVHFTSSDYPPSNTIKLSENQYRIVMAVAGFASEEINISVAEDRLTIQANKSVGKSEKEWVYLHRGIATRDFRRVFPLRDLVVKEVVLKDGLLTVDLERVIPEEKLPKKIAIKTA